VEDVQTGCVHSFHSVLDLWRTLDSASAPVSQPKEEERHETDRLVLLVAAAVVAGCNANSKPVTEDVRPVRTVAVGATQGSVGASYPGEIRARHESKLGFRNSGKVSQRLVEVGQQVKRGQVLMRLDPEQENLRDVSALASVDAAKRASSSPADRPRAAPSSSSRASSRPGPSWTRPR
jgi:multidrug efflux pump subunit AcrA (membrane-fusion protein)